MNITKYLPIEFFNDSFETGQAQLAQKTRILLYKSDPSLFELLDFNEDATFLEPLLFSYFVDPTPLVSLQQILFGYITEDLRPKEIQVYVDKRGIIDLPRIGYLRTTLKNRELRLIWKGGVDNCILKDGNRMVEYVHENPIFVEGSCTEVCRYNHPLLEKFFIDSNGKRVDVDIENIARQHINHLSKAFLIIQKNLPDYYEDMLKATRKIVLYSSHLPFSFATLSAHGIVFLNASEDDDEVFFIEDLIHQCGHIIFSAQTLDPQEFLKINPHTLLKQLTCDERDTRDVYSTLHGVFTEMWMSLCMDLCYESNYFSSRQKHELLGRFALILTRFGCDLQNLRVPDIFTDKGEMLLNSLAQVYFEIVSKRYDLLSQFDISNQPYCFSYRSFQSSNPQLIQFD